MSAPEACLLRRHEKRVNGKGDYCLPDTAVQQMENRNDRQGRRAARKMSFMARLALGQDMQHSDSETSRVVCCNEGDSRD